MDRSQPIIGNPETETPQTPSDGSVRIVENPRLHAVADELGRRIVRGDSDADVLNYLSENGVPPGTTNIAEILGYRAGVTPRGAPTYRAWRRANPHSGFPVHDSFYRREEAQTGVPAWIGWAANSPVGAYFAHAGDTLSLGTLDNLSADPEQARRNLEVLGELYPGSSTAGSIAGTVLSAPAFEGAAARFGLRGLWAARGGDALYGAAYGAGSADDGNRLAGAGWGALTGLAGGEGGRRTLNLGGRALTGTRDWATRRASELGLPLTLGQMASRGGPVGRWLGRQEDRLADLPGLGDDIGAARARGSDEFNRQAIDLAASPVGGEAPGAIGTQGVDAAESAIADARRTATAGVEFDVDRLFARRMAGAERIGSRLPRGRSRDFRRLVDDIVTPATRNGRMSAEAYASARQALREARETALREPGGQGYARAISRVERALAGVAGRRAPAMAAAIANTEAAAARARVVDDATRRGENSGGRFTPGQLGQAVQFGTARAGRSEAAALDPLADLERAARDLLPRYISRAQIAGQAVASPRDSALMAILRLPYTPAGAAKLQRLIVSRPDLVRRAGEALLRSKWAERIAGATGAHMLEPEHKPTAPHH